MAPLMKGRPLYNGPSDERPTTLKVTYIGLLLSFLCQLQVTIRSVLIDRIVYIAL